MADKAANDSAKCQSSGAALGSEAVGIVERLPHPPTPQQVETCHPDRTAPRAGVPVAPRLSTPTLSPSPLRVAEGARAGVRLRECGCPVPGRGCLALSVHP